MGRYAVMADGESRGTRTTQLGVVLLSITCLSAPNQRPASLQQAPDMVSVCFPILDLN